MTESSLVVSSCDSRSRSWLLKVGNTNLTTRPDQLDTIRGTRLPQPLNNLISEIDSHPATALYLPFHRCGVPPPPESCGELIAIGKNDSECCVVVEVDLAGSDSHPIRASHSWVQRLSPYRWNIYQRPHESLISEELPTTSYHRVMAGT